MDHLIFRACHGGFRPLRNILALASLLAIASTSAFALSELKEEDVAPPPQVQSVPLPDPIENPANRAPSAPAADEPAEPDSEEPATDEAEEPLPEILRDISLLPEPVRNARALMIKAAKEGNIEELRPLIRTDGENTTQLSLGGVEGDPVAFLKELSGDDEGHEILAILEEVLEAGYVHLDAGTENEIYLWPYFFAVPLDSLTGAQRVELFRLVTAGDYEDMKNFGAYIFYRVGIRPDGSWAFFVAGD